MHEHDYEKHGPRKDLEGLYDESASTEVGTLAPPLS